MSLEASNYSLLSVMMTVIYIFSRLSFIELITNPSDVSVFYYLSFVFYYKQFSTLSQTFIFPLWHCGAGIVRK